MKDMNWYCGRIPAFLVMSAYHYHQDDDLKRDDAWFCLSWATSNGLVWC